MDRYFKEKGDWAALKSAIILIICALSIGCSRSDVGKPVLGDSVRMNAPGYSIGVPQGAAAMTVVEERFPKCRIEYFGSLSDGYLAVKHRKIDAFAFDKHTLQYVTLQNPDLSVMDEKIADESIVAGAAMERQDLIDKVNAFIRQYRADGTYKDMYRRWLLKEGKGMPLLPEPKSPAATLKIGTEGLNEPMNYYADGLLTGFDIEFARRLGIFLNAKVTFQTMEFSALVPAVESGKIDLLIAGLNATDERRKKILMSDVYIDSEISFLVRKDRLPAKATGKKAITDFSQLSGRKVGILTGSSYDALIKKELPTAIPYYFNTFADQAAALKAGQIEGFLVDEPVARDIVKSTSGITCLKKMVCTDSYAFAFAKNRHALRAEVNAVLKEFQDQGVIKAIDAKWFGDNEAAKVLPELKTDGRNGVIRFASDSSAPPFVFVKDGRMVGYEIEIAARVADKLSRRLEIINMDFAAIIPALVSGKADMAGSCITVTEERARSVLFSLPTYSVGVALMVASSGSAGEKHGVSPLYSGFIESFRRTFLVEDRWVMVLRGLQTTVLITILSALFGTLLGALVCMIRRAQTRWMNIPAKVFIRGIQGTPIVVLLMILYYIVFGSVDINGIFVAVIGFSINFAAYVSEMMRAGIDTVDRGQREAAMAIGFSRFQVFLRITFPQAARHILPVFKGEFISMLKMTSIVGYIAIQDLTKMSDIIRSRTYEAFFPLIATALIYFVIAYIMISLLSLLEMRIDPRRRRRLVRGVVNR